MRPQGPKEIRIRPGEDEYLSPEERRRQRALARRNPITYKIRKGKKDITEEPGPPRKSKAARFADPRDPFGKRSLVKKFRSGELFAQLEGQGQGRRGGKVQQGETDGHLQHDDFVRQMMGGDLGNLSDSRKKESFSRSSGAPHGGRSKAPAWGEKDRGDRGDRRAPSEGYSKVPPWGEKDRGERSDRGDRRAPPEGYSKVPSWGEKDRGERSNRGDRPATSEGYGKSLPWGEKDRGDRGDRRAPSEGYGKPSAWGEKDRSDRGDRYASSEGYKKTSAWGEKDRGDRYAPVKGGDRDMFDLSSRESRRAPDPPAYDERQSPSSRSSYRPETTSPDSSYRPNRPSRSNKSDEVDEDGEADEAWVKKQKRQEVPVSLPYATAASQFLYGTSTVEAALQANRRKLYRLYIYKGKDRRSKSLEKDMAIGDLAKRRGIKVEYVDEAALPMLNKMSGSRPHNGHILEASPLPQMPVRALGELTDTEGGPGFRISPGHQSYEEAEVNGTSQFVPLDPDSRKPLVLMVDEVLDPGNLGAILRTASFMGVTAVAVSKRGSAPITPVVLKASAGAAETLIMFSVESVEGFLKDSRRQGWKVYAAVAPTHGSARRQVDTMDIEKEDPLLNNPCILLVGNEGEGLSRALRRASDIEVSIPNLSGSTVVDSLNVSVATGLLCSAFLRGKAKSFGDSVHVVKDAGAIF
ncbi:rRNA methyltransferase 1, mitochondrial [Cytospora mali]|uniref:rRNA methyltransferase 1, mitochondrial n=1 Tax=Cytospora mali TaxID=578113 RepID=A0A194WCQ4_CYTMA|nr:rRNA methyltransferase 1, mitochondrial [Valsa mali]